MEWFAPISTTALFALALWLSRNLIITRLTNSVRYEYENKLESLKADLRQNEEIVKADLKAKASQIDALRSGVLSGITSREAAIFQRRLAAVEQLWDAVISLGPAKSVSAWMAVVKFEPAAKEAAKNPRFREIFSVIGSFDLNSLSNNPALRTRPFVSPIVWAYYSAYQAIIFHAVARLQMLKSGIDMVEVIDNKNVTNLVKAALPHQVQYIEQFGPGAFHYLLDELENNLLAAFQQMFKGDESDKDTLEKAAAIIKQSEVLMDTNAKPGVTK